MEVDQCHLRQHESFVIPVGVWHQGINTTDSPCHILEVQYGSECIESDIERRYPESYTTEEIVEATNNLLE